MPISRSIYGAALLAAGLILSGCNSGSSSSQTPAPEPTPPPATHTIGGAVSGLPSGKSVTLQNNGGDNLTLSGTGASQNFTFATALANGASYAVTVATQPAGMTCAVSNGSGTMASSNITAVAVSCSANQFAYVANFQGNTINVYQVEADGSLSYQSSTPTAQYPRQLAVTSDGKYLYLQSQFNGLTAYSINPSSGALTQLGSPYNSGTTPYGVTINGSTLFSTDNNQNMLYRYAINTDGSLTLAANSPFSATYRPYKMATSSDGAYLYVTGSPYQTFFIVDTASTLTSMPNINSANGSSNSSSAPNAVVTTGNYVYVSNGGDASIAAYQNTGSTTLTAVAGSPFAVTGTATPQPDALAVDASGQHLYAADTANNTLITLSIDPSTHALTQLNGSVYSGGNQPFDLAIDSSGRYLYVANRGAGGYSVSAYSIDPTTGTLTLIGSPITSNLNAPCSIVLAQPQ